RRRSLGTTSASSAATHRTALIAEVVRWWKNGLLLHPGDMERLGIARTAAIVEEHLHRRHPAARREIQAHNAAIRKGELARMNLRNCLDAGRCAQLQRRVDGTGGMSRPVADLASTEIPETAPVIGNVVIAEWPHGRCPDPQVPIERGWHTAFRRRLL